MSWFALDGYAVLRFCGALAVLLLVYYLLFDRKARFIHCRYYLLSIIFVAAMAAFIRIPVYPSESVVMWVADGQKVPETGEPDSRPEVQEQEIIQETTMGERIEEKEVQTRILDSWEGWQQLVQHVNLYVLIYVVVAFLLLLRWLLAMMSIMRLKRWGSCSRENDVLVVKNNQVTSPFSFFRMIFINRKLKGETLEVILSHEKNHIAHKHYRDTFLMEMFCIFFWFNPCVWWVKRELKALHEFEVDHCLLANGLELSKYQNIIFDELMGYGPGIANGFHNSMIKKRFIMMKEKNTIRYSLLRKVIMLPAFAGVVALFAFTEKKPVPGEAVLPVMANIPAVKIPVQPGNVVSDVERKEEKPSMEIIMPVFNPVSVQPDTIATQEDVKKGPDPKYAPFKGREGFMFYPLREEQVVVSLLPFKREEVVKYIVTDKDETRVTIAVPIYFDSNWVQFDKGFCMVDRQSGDTYMIRSMTRGIELNKTYCVEGKKERMAEFTMVFPPLKAGVKYIDMYQKYPEMQAPIPSNGSSSCFKNLKVEDYLPPKNIDKYYDREGRPIQSHQVEYVKLRDDQVVVSDLPWSREEVLKSIITDGKTTRVTIAVPINFDRNWVQFSKGFCIEDTRKGDIYQIQSVDRGIELNKTLVVVGKKGKMVEFTMVFPCLKKKAKVINMYNKFWEESALAPTNSDGDWEWLRVKVADYNTAKGHIYY